MPQNKRKSSSIWGRGGNRRSTSINARMREPTVCALGYLKSGGGKILALDGEVVMLAQPAGEIGEQEE